MWSETSASKSLRDLPGELLQSHVHGVHAGCDGRRTGGDGCADAEEVIAGFAAFYGLPFPRAFKDHLVRNVWLEAGDSYFQQRGIFERDEMFYWLDVGGASESAEVAGCDAGYGGIERFAP